MQVFGLQKILELYTLRELWVMFAKQSQKSWYKLMSDIKKISLPAAPTAFGVIRDHLARFRPLKMAK